jgi:hypothetical protein
MTNEKIEYRSSTELALELYPVVKGMIDDDPRVHPVIMVEALYLLMQMVDGPAAAGRVISFTQIRR